MEKAVNKEHAQDAGKVLAGGLLGFLFFMAGSYPKSSVYKKLPEKKIKSVSLFPNVKVYKKDENYHIHHWMIFSALYPLIFLKKNFAKSKFLHGLFLGSIFQGLIYKDRFQVRYKTP